MKNIVANKDNLLGVRDAYMPQAGSNPPDMAKSFEILAAHYTKQLTELEKTLAEIERTYAAGLTSHSRHELARAKLDKAIATRRAWLATKKKTS